MPESVAQPFTRRSPGDYEEFLFHEASLLDSWQLEAWLGLFAEGATYDVPWAGATDTASSSEELFYISDDWFRLQQRVKRLLSPGAHSEWPHSQTTRLISNVRVLGEVDTGTAVSCVFITYRAKGDKTDTFFGHHNYVFTEVAQDLRIASKRTLLAMAGLRPQGRVSIIV